MLYSAELMRRYLDEVVANGNIGLIESIAHADMIDEGNVAFGGPPGRDGLVAHVKGFRKHIADCEISIHNIIGHESEVMAWWSFTGRHVGPWFGVPPTGEIIKGDVFSFFSLTDGLIRRYRLWLHADLASGVTFDSSKAIEISKETDLTAGLSQD